MNFDYVFMDTKVPKGTIMKFSDIKYLFYKSNRKQLVTVSTMVANVALGAVYVVLSMVKLSLFLGFAGAFNIVLALGKYYALERLLRIKETDEKTIAIPVITVNSPSRSFPVYGTEGTIFGTSSTKKNPAEPYTEKSSAKSINSNNGNRSKNTVEMKSISKINNCTLICSSLFFCFGFVITFFYEDPASYEFWMIMYIAATAFIKVFSFLVSAIVNLRKKSGVQYYVKLMSAAAALISLAITQRAILYYVGIENASILSGVGGIIFSLLATVVALFMLKKARNQKKYLFENNLLDEKAKEEILIKQEKYGRITTAIKDIFIRKK